MRPFARTRGGGPAQMGEGDHGSHVCGEALTRRRRVAIER